MGIIYCARNKINGMRYIGQSRNSLESKKKAYIWRSRSQKQGDTLLLTIALREFGEEAFEWSIVFDDVPNEDLDEYEIDAIFVYKTVTPNGYNRMSGGLRGGKHSEESRKKISDVQIGHKRGPHSEETRKKLSEINKVRPPRSEETRKKLSDAAKNISAETRKKLSVAAGRRKPPSEETRKKMSESRKGNQNAKRKTEPE